MRSTASRLALLAALVAFGSPAPAQAPKFSDDVVFTFIAEAGAKDVLDALPKDNNPNIVMRPNDGGEFHLYVKNPAKALKTYTVELASEPKGTIAARIEVKIPGDKWMRVRIPKPAPEPVVAVVPVAAPAPTTPPAPKVELPSGQELIRSNVGFRFVLRLLAKDDDGALAPVKGADGADLGRVCTVTLAKPSAYLEVDKPKLVAPKDKPAIITVPVKAIAGKASGDATVQLYFPPTLNAPGLMLREGVYRRAISLDGGPNASVQLRGSIQKYGKEFRAEVSIDGVARAFIFTSEPKGDVTDELQNFDTKVVRILSAKSVTRPTAAFPIKLEVDNAPDNANLEVQIRQVGSDSKDDANSEVLPLKGSRQERVWIDLAGKIDGGFAIGNRSVDWVVPLDLRERRGRLEVVCTIPGTAIKSDPFIITVDATAPEDVKFLKLPAQHIKGTPLPVTAALQDLDTKVVKAVFFLGELQEDGKLPEGPKVAGTRALDPKTKLPSPVEWIGLMPLPPEKRGEITIGVAVTDEVGNTATETQKVELVDPPAPNGTIIGKVVIGERAQPGLTVILADGEGKPKGETKTDAFGKFKFEKVAPGAYTLKTSKTDVTLGLTGTAPAQVENGKTVKPEIVLKRNLP